MAVSLPTAADVRKIREQAAHNVVEQAEVARTPLFAVLGVGDFAVTTVTKVVTGVRSRATQRAELVQSRVTDLPRRLSPEELRKAVTDLRAQAEKTYENLAERGEKTWGRFRKQPTVKQVISTIETNTEKLDARVDGMVDDAHDVAEKALSTVTRQTRSTGEKVAQSTQKFAASTAEAVSEASEDVSEAVAVVGSEVADKVVAAGDEAAHETRSVARKTASRTAPKPATRKPAASENNGSTTSS